MFSNAVAWYTARAGQIFAVLIVSVVALEFVSRRSRGELSIAERRSTVTSITSGVAFIVAKSIVGKLAVTTLMFYAFDHWCFSTLDFSDPLVWILMFVIRDFVYYWVHRAEHRVRLLWASHMVHHSPETIGFTTAVRVPWMEALYKPWLGMWVPLIGFHPLAAVALDVTAAAFAQMYHTERVRRLPVIDSVFVTPSAHRVHHGSNPEYLDKSYGAVFIVWDKLFGTFEPERAAVVYGIGRKRIDSPVGALVGGFPTLLEESRRLPRWGEKMRYVASPPAERSCGEMRAEEGHGLCPCCLRRPLRVEAFAAVVVEGVTGNLDVQLESRLTADRGIQSLDTFGRNEIVVAAEVKQGGARCRVDGPEHVGHSGAVVAHTCGGLGSQRNGPCQRSPETETHHTRISVHLIEVAERV